ncbi:hypothetical protein CLV75_1562 [Ruegeria conchae]|uniref:Uncharacterized protein n=1 Tax=Ruegeria conchae TaxID=981384 RepID=A0A497ZGR3_9RHOB|nr:hypothetical protein CLV75_1562 [Ruegeria conchae]
MFAGNGPTIFLNAPQKGRAQENLEADVRPEVVKVCFVPPHCQSKPDQVNGPDLGKQPFMPGAANLRHEPNMPVFCSAVNLGFTTSQLTFEPTHLNSC